VSRDKARDQDRFEAVRRDRLEAAGVLWTRDREDEPRIEYMPDELVTVDADSARQVEQELDRLETGWSRREGPRSNDTRAPVIIECGGDPLETIRRVNESRGGRGESDLRLAPNHVLSIARTKIGPGSDPWPADPGERGQPGTPVSGTAPVIGVVDTGRWDPMPATVAIADPGGTSDLDPLDIDPADLVVDYPGGGHGGFIAGLINHRAGGIGLISRRGYRAGTQEILTEDSVVRAADEVVAAGSRIVNLSLGTYAGGGIVLRDAVERWVADGCLVVAAAGNDGLARPWYPAGYAADPALAHGVVSVGALETRVGDGPAVPCAAAPFSNHGPWVTAWAPGADVVSDYPMDHKFPYDPGDLAVFSSGLAHWDGTSFAAPFVAAEIARYAAENDLGDDVQQAWAELKADSPFLVFWPTEDDTADPDHGRYSRRPRPVHR
jgi:hypothetical protein